MSRSPADQLSVLSIPFADLGALDEGALKDGLLRNPGISRVDLSKLESQAVILYDANRISEQEIKAALAQRDFLVPGARAGWQRMAARHGVTLQLTAAAVLFVLALGATWAQRQGQPVAKGLPALLFAAMFLLALPAFLRCLKGLFTKGRLTADLLVWLIAAAAAGVGRWPEASCVIFLSVLADFLRIKTLQPARLAGAHEDNLLARRVTVREGDETREISLADIRKDQVLVVRQGQMVPADGMVLAGKAEVRDAALTGESTYQTRTAGQAILAGTILESGSLDIRVTRAGKETLLASVDRLVNKALSHAGKGQSFMDRFIRGYLMSALALAIVVFALYGQHIFWSSETTTGDSLRTALAVLLGACPLALVLAGPLTLYAGLLRAARLGILVKGGHVLEKMASLRILLLDKTGTLTYAKPVVSRIKPFRGFTKEQVVEAALFVERQSTHPIARTICEYGAEMKAEVVAPEKFLEFEGGGACAMKGDYYVKVGALWLMEDGRDMEPEVLDWMAEVKDQGLSFVLVANRTRIMGGIVLEDALRENAKAVVDGLRGLGLRRLVMLTGDNAQTARRVTDEVGLDEAESECMPDRKLVRIQHEKSQGQGVGMVGDGINDAPALAAADVGIAMGSHSSDMAVEAASVALINNDLGDLYKAFAISKATALTLRVSAFTAVLGNLLLIVLSAARLIDLTEGVLLQVVLLAVTGLLAASLYFRPRF